MRRIQVLGIVLTLFFVLISTNIATAQANPRLVFVGSFGGALIPVHPNMTVTFLDIRESPVGRADALEFSEIVGMEEKPVAAVTDNEEFAGFLEAMLFPIVVVVENEELEVWMKGRTMFAELTVPAVPLHPIYAEIKGCSGKPIKGEEIEPLPGGGEMTMTYISYEAVVSLVYDGTPCPLTVGIVGPQFLLKVTPPST